MVHVPNAAGTLREAVKARRSARLVIAGAGLDQPRQKWRSVDRNGSLSMT